MDPDVRGFETYLRADMRPDHSVKCYLAHVRRLLVVSGKRARELQAAHLDAYKAHLALDRKCGKGGIAQGVYAVRAFARFLGRPEIAVQLKAPKPKMRIPRFVSEQDVAALLRVVQSRPRDFAIVATLAFTGIRVAELVSLDVDDIDFAQGTLMVRHGKGDKERMIPLDARLASALQSYLAFRVQCGKGASGPLFASQCRERISTIRVHFMVKRAAEAAGIRTRVTPHILRSTLATTLLRKGIDIRIIQRILGHASIASTQIYAAVEDSTMRAAIERADLRFIDVAPQQPGLVVLQKKEV